MLSGMSRPAATQFSFYLALPTLTAASLFSLVKALHSITAAEASSLAVGFVSAFITALLVIRRLPPLRADSRLPPLRILPHRLRHLLLLLS
jgi:undecaprenyl-diphosphatase